jgi:hypothetical protein
LVRKKEKVQASQEGLLPLSFGLYGEGSLSEECGAVKLVQPYFSLDYTCEENVSSETMLTKLISARALLRRPWEISTSLGLGF